MNYKKLAELAQEAITLQEVHKDYMNGHVIKEHDITCTRERLKQISIEIFSISSTVINLSDKTLNTINEITYSFPDQKHFEVCLKGNSMIDENKIIESFDLHSVSLVRKQ